MTRLDLDLEALSDDCPGCGRSALPRELRLGTDPLVRTGILVRVSWSCPCGESWSFSDQLTPFAAGEMRRSDAPSPGP